MRALLVPAAAAAAAAAAEKTKLFAVLQLYTSNRPNSIRTLVAVAALARPDPFQPGFHQYVLFLTLLRLLSCCRGCILSAEGEGICRHNQVRLWLLNLCLVFGAQGC